MRSAAFAAILACLAAAPANADGSPAPKHKVTQSESYVMIDPLYATIVDAGRPCGTLMVAIGLDIPNSHLRGEAERAMPVLRDAYVRSLTSFTSAAVRPWQQPDVRLVAARMQRATDRALHQPGARVLLAEVAMHITR